MPEYVEHEIGDLTVRIEKDTCISTGNCIKLAPDVFEFDAKKIVAFTDGSAHAKLSDADRDRIVEACSLCPVDALKVYDADGNQLVP